MIKFKVRSYDRGEDLSFPDPASAIIAAQDEIDRWEKAIGPSLSNQPPGSFPAFRAPLRAWQDAVDDLNRFRRISTSKDDLEIDYQALVFSGSIVGSALNAVSRALGPSAANAAAISENLDDGQVNWLDDAAVKGVLIYERFKRINEEFDVNEAIASPIAKMHSIDDRLIQLSRTVSDLDEIVNSSIENSRQQMAISKTSFDEQSVELLTLSKTLNQRINELSKKLDGEIVVGNESIQSSVDAAEKEFKLGSVLRKRGDSCKRPLRCGWSERIIMSDKLQNGADGLWDLVPSGW